MSPCILIRSHNALHDRTGLGGADRLMMRLATALNDSGWEVAVLCPHSSDPRPGGSITFHDFPYGTPASPVIRVFNTVRGARTFQRVTRETSFDVVLDDISHIPFYPAHFLCPEETVNAAFVHTAFFNAARQYNGPIKGSVTAFFDWTLPYLDRPEIVCAGPSTQGRIHDALGYRRTHVLNPSIEADSFEYQFNPEAKRILCLGRLTGRKNIECLIRAWPAVEAAHPDYTLSIAGTGYREEALRECRREVGAENVEFLGYVEEAEKRRLFSESLLFLLPSLMEGYVTTGLEAMASGTPVVGSDTYGINDYVIDGETGYLFETDDSVALAATLNRLLADPGSLERVAQRGRALAADHSFERFRDRADNLFRELIA